MNKMNAKERMQREMDKTEEVIYTTDEKLDKAIARIQELSDQMLKDLDSRMEAMKKTGKVTTAMKDELADMMHEMTWRMGERFDRTPENISMWVGRMGSGKTGRPLSPSLVEKAGIIPEGPKYGGNEILHVCHICATDLPASNHESPVKPGFYKGGKQLASPGFWQAKEWNRYFRMSKFYLPTHFPGILVIVVVAVS